MMITAEQASDAFLARLSQELEAAPGNSEPLTRAQAMDILRWLTASHYHAAMQLVRLREAGFDLYRDDGKAMGGWIVEETENGNRMEVARLRLEEDAAAKDDPKRDVSP
ncbi:hypothetical protein [Allosphingosinicella flava]|nr:hypothetical protein [Sphingosinicella flava]